MALADTARLIASLELKDKFSGGIKTATASLGGFETRMGRIGGIASRGFGAAAANIAKLTVVAGAGLGAAIKGGLDDLATLEDATTSVDGAIKQLGLTGQLTSKQVAMWANDIERDIGAAFDDKEITAAATTLLRFGKVTPKNLRRTLEVMTDLAAKTGSVDSAATLLAKALADPTKAAGKLARMGIILTKAEQDQVKALSEAGDAAGAQAKVLDILARTTRGAAEASQGPYQRALSTLADVSEDAKKALAEGFLPVIQRVAGVLSNKLGDPRAIDQIRTLGRGLADAFSKTLDAAEKIPWSSIGDAMRLAGKGAKAALDLFTGLPPWVQTAVLTGWGLNKLTGGAVGGIVGELGKGLIKGVLSMSAAVVNINAATVNGAGGIPGTPAAAAGKLPGGIGLGAVIPLAGIPLAIAGLTTAILDISDPGRERARAGRMATAVARGIPNPLGVNDAKLVTTNARLSAVAFSAAHTARATDSVRVATRLAGERARDGALQARDAIRHKDLSVNLTVNARLSARDAQTKLTFQQRAAEFG